MIYVVSGFMRSGTSMMMACLKAGGIEPAFSESREREMAKMYPDANPSFMELTHKDRATNLPNTGEIYGYFDGYMETPEFTEKFNRMYDEKSLKILSIWGWQLPKTVDCEIIFCKRDPEAIRESLRKMMGVDQGSKFVKSYDEVIPKYIENLRQHHPVYVSDYDRFVDNPNFPEHWPLNIERARSVVNTGWRN